MEWVETTGRTIEEAKEHALDELGVDEQDAEFEVLEEPKIGLFGRLRSEGRIRARVRPTTPRAKDDRRDRRRRTKSSADGSTEAQPPTSAGGAAVADRPKSESRPRGGRSKSAAAKVGTGAGTVTASTSPPDSSQQAGGTADSSAPGGPRTNPSRRRGRPAGSRPDATAPGKADPAPRPRSSVALSAATSSPSTVPDTMATDDVGVIASPEPGANSATVPSGAEDATTSGARSGRARSRKRTAPKSSAASRDDGIDVGEANLMDVALDEQGKVAEQFLVGLLDSFGLAAEIAVAIPDDDTIDIQLTGSDLGLLIGPKGSTLLSIQELTRTVVQRKTSAGNGRIFIDVAGYRQKRNEALSRFAQKVASDVLASQARVAMEPMSAPDRKTVHDAITAISGVETISEGEDARRHVVVVPTGG